ncbi:Glycerol-3-phosphate acyltransferase [Spathaspora sp. JA1]|nr:Glycerol-3-phosphate acyltransferase [Spathaspora sp. JA1]
MGGDISNSDFDVNLLEDPIGNPTIDLKFPLPIDKEANEASISRSFNLLHNAFRFFTGSEQYDKIYKDNETHFFTQKYSSEFSQKFQDYVNDKLENSDEKLDELIYDLVTKELNMKLIKASQFKSRFQEVKLYMVNYYKAQNKKNLPTFSSSDFIRSAYVTVLKIMQKLFPRGIWVSNQDISDLYVKYLENPMSIAFLPSHQSHLDYIIIHIICIRFQMATPAVIAGENLNVTLVGEFLKKLGAIFIPRSFNNEAYTERNLNNVIEFLLVNKVNFEVFVEGTRSRDGKLLLPKYGILKSLVHIYLKQTQIEKNKNFDILLQPVAVTYERVYENDGYLKELIGEDKKQESLLNMVSVAGSAFFSPNEKVVLDKHGFQDNSDATLTGKIFVKLGSTFTMSHYINEDDQEFSLKLNNPTTPITEQDFDQVNLKKLGFKILHEINKNSFLPEISIVGTSIQAYYYISQKRTFPVRNLIPVLKLVGKILLEESQESKTNSQILKNVLQLSDKELISLIKFQIVSFFRFIKVNDKSDLIKIETPIELLYYKNLSIHLIIHRCLVSFILLLLDGKNTSHRIIGKLFYIVTGFLKNEFLFDYDDNPRTGPTFILNDMVASNLITKDEYDNSYQIVDYQHLQLFANLAQPFLESYDVLISNIVNMTNDLANNYAKNKRLQNGNGKLILDDNDLKYPDTKGLLKYIIEKSRGSTASLESFNKQYLVSDLYYLNNLQVIGIFKNKAKTKAFVQITNIRDLKILNEFLHQIIGKSKNHNLITDELNVNYIIDIIDKNFDRDLNELNIKGKF